MFDSWVDNDTPVVDPSNPIQVIHRLLGKAEIDRYPGLLICILD
jgi:hypothetical protein